MSLSKLHFWNWFKRHNVDYLTLQTKSKNEKNYLMNELDAHLRAYFKFFGFTLYLPDQKTGSLTIRVKGKARHFKKVDAMIAKAPELQGWTFIALDEPQPIDFFLQDSIEKSGIDPRELFFSFDEDYKSIDIYHPLCTPDNRDHLQYLASTAVYNLLGERVYGEEINTIDVYNLSAIDRNMIAPLEELPAYMGSRNSGVVVDREGNFSLRE